MLGFRLLRAYDSGVHIVRQLAILIGDLLAQGEFPRGVVLAPGALVDHAQMVMRRGIPRLQLNGGFERRESVSNLAIGDQRPSQADESVGKSSVEPRGLAKL